jgi:hypothetical protein
MNSVQKKLDDLEKLKKEMSQKLDNYEYSYHKSKEKIDLPILNHEKQENITTIIIQEKTINKLWIKD